MNKTKSIFLENLYHAYAQTDGTYNFPNSREGDMLRQAKWEIEALRGCASQVRAEDSCTTHHHTHDCREAVHKEVADALRHALFELEHATPGRGAEMFFAVRDKGRAAIKKYEEMYP